MDTAAEIEQPERVARSRWPLVLLACAAFSSCSEATIAHTKPLSDGTSACNASADVSCSFSVRSGIFGIRLPDDAIEAFQDGWTTNPPEWFARTFWTAAGSAELIAGYYEQAMVDDGWQLRRPDGFVHTDDGRLIYEWVASSKARPVTMVIFQEADRVVLSLNAQCLQQRCAPVVDSTPAELRG